MPKPDSPEGIAITENYLGMMDKHRKLLTEEIETATHRGKKYIIYSHAVEKYFTSVSSLLSAYRADINYKG